MKLGSRVAEAKCALEMGAAVPLFLKDQTKAGIRRGNKLNQLDDALQLR